ncbi:hypothetical protein [Alkalibacterium thalassium]|uniref:Uncharacterized protein n=1 Tax=Alkalibacterium thalassium TaxID=426701 RepID=A0A1G9DMZ0_9LACT|nr:hypothetical protein [Alkalibacterium thalassium]SDK65258.1 hypothetical protein SAMN04488098_10479 [Alkalibacterium thalassium]
MKKIDDTQKSILIGVGVAFLVGILTFLFSSDNAKKKTKAIVNRQKAKHYVNDKFNSKSAKKLVSKLTDDEINLLAGAAGKVSDLEDKFSDMKDYMQDKSKDAKKAFKKVKK